jgi:hypothetical protein
MEPFPSPSFEPGLVGAVELGLSPGAGAAGAAGDGLVFELGAGVALGVSCISPDFESSPQALIAARTRTLLAAKCAALMLPPQRTRRIPDARSGLPGSIPLCIARSFFQPTASPFFLTPSFRKPRSVSGIRSYDFVKAGETLAPRVAGP